MIIYSSGYKISSHDYNRNTLLPWNRENCFSELWIVLFDLSRVIDRSWNAQLIKLGAWQLCAKRYHLFKKKKTLSSNSRATCSSCCLLIEPHKTWYNIYHSYVSEIQVIHEFMVQKHDDSCFIFIALGSLSHIESTMLQSLYNRAFISYRLSLGEATNRCRFLIWLDFNWSSCYYVSPALPCAFARSSSNWVGRLFLRCS